MEKTKDLTNGSEIKSILWFAFPILIGNIFQQLYNVVDTAVIGNVLGNNALAAVGASGPIYSLVIWLAVGFTSGFSVILARFFGANDEGNMKRSVSLIYTLTVLIAILLSVGSVLILPTILKLLHTPKAIFQQTYTYLIIILASAIITIFYNMLSALLRAIGNSKMPLYFLIVSSFINVVLDILFVKYLHMGIGGAAYATVIAQFISAILCLIYIYKRCPLLKFERKYLTWDGTLIKELFFMGLSMGLMYVAVSIGSVALQGAVNSLGEDTIAAHTAARKIDDIFMLPLGTLSSAASTFASQNLGAGKLNRIKKGINKTIGIAMGWSLVSTVVCYCFGSKMLEALTGSDSAFVINTAFQYVKINIPFFVVLSVLLVLRSSLQGLGRKVVSVCGSVIELIFKFGAVGVITKQLGYFGVCILEPIIWIICAALVFSDYMLFLRQQKRKVKSE